MSNELVHFRPSTQTYNKRCLNGSAHVMSTDRIEFVTCPLCLNPKTNVEFWYENGMPRNFKKPFSGLNLQN